MAASMQSMAGPGQMMPQQQQIPAALAQHVANALRLTQQQLVNPTWQAAVPLPDRMSKVMQMISNLRLANQNTDIMQATNYGIGFEREMFSKMPTKENYDQAMTNKTNEFFRKRQQNEPALQQQLSQNAQAQAMMNMNLQQQMGRGMTPQAFQSMQQGMQPMNMQQQMFQQQRLQQQVQQQRQQQQQQQGQQQLRQQMPQQGQQLQQQQTGNGMNPGMGMGMGMGGMAGMNGMNMNMAMANQAGRGMNPNQQMANMANGPQRQAPVNMNQWNASERQKISEIGNRMMAQASDESKQNAAMFVRSRMTPQQLQEFQAAGKDPTVFYYQQQAANLYRRQRAQQQQLQGQNQVQGQAPAMQQQHSQQAMQQQHQNMLGNAAGNNNFSQFPPSMESIKDQQMNGMKAQEAGQVVVPASMAQGMNRGSQPMAQTMSNQQHPNQAARQPQPQQQQQGPNMQQRKMNGAGQASQAQLQAQAQMNPMQSQPSNMGGNMGPGQSPGMGTLNTPVTRPGSGMNQLGANQGVGQGNVQFGDQRFAQGMQRPNSQAYNAMLADLTPEQRQQISEIAPEKVQEMIRRWQLGRQNQMNMNQQNMNPMANRTPNQMGGQPTGNMAGQGPQGVQQSPQAANMAQTQAIMDNMDIPETILQQLSQFIQLGPEVKKWRDLRAWVSQNPNSLPPQIKNELGPWQRRQFQAILQRRANQAGGQASMSMNQPQANAAAGQMAMGQNGMQRTQPAQNMPAHLMQVSAQDLAQIRASKPQFQSLTDEHLRTIVLAMKKNAWQQRQSILAQQVQNQGQGQNQANVGQMGTNMLGQAAGMNLQPPMQAGQNAQAQRNQNSAGQATPIQGTQQKGPEQANNNNNRNNNNKKPQAQPTPSPAQGPKSLKRPNSDEADASAASQNQKPRSAQGQGQNLPQLSQDEIVNMKPDQRAKYEQMRRAQMAAATQGTQLPQAAQAAQASQNAQASQAAQAPTNVQSAQSASESLARLKLIGQEEQRSFQQQAMPEIPMAPQELHDTAQRLQRMVGDMSKIGRGLSKWYSLTQDDHRARLFFRTRLRILKQFVDGEGMTILRDSFSIHSSELDQARAMLESMAKDLARSVFGRNMMKTQQGQNAGQNAGQKPPGGQGTPQVAGQPQQQSPQTAPLNAANLEKNSQALKAQKQAGKGFKVPNAPTTTQPPFSFAAPSPHGNPSYANVGDPQIDLKLPPRKKSKVSQAATPSPQVSKASPPRPQSQLLDAQQSRPAEPQKPVFTCKDPECEHSPIGYPNEEALQKHVVEEHIKPREDPLKFCEESLAVALGLEPDGTAKKDPSGAAAPAMVATLSKQGRGKDIVNTPDSTTSMKRSASSQKDGKSAIKANDTAAALSTAMDPWANATFDPQMLMTSLGLENGISSVIFDVNAFRALTPEWTPESRDEPSEPNSDISDGAQLDIDLSWQLPEPFETDLLLDLDKTSLQVEPILKASAEVPTMDPSLLFPSVQAEMPDWQEITSDFSKPFELDTSLYAMDYES